MSCLGPGPSIIGKRRKFQWSNCVSFCFPSLIAVANTRLHDALLQDFCVFVCHSMRSNPRLNVFRGLLDTSSIWCSLPLCSSAETRALPFVRSPIFPSHVPFCLLLSPWIAEARSQPVYTLTVGDEQTGLRDLGVITNHTKMFKIPSRKLQQVKFERDSRGEGSTRQGSSFHVLWSIVLCCSAAPALIGCAVGQGYARCW